jgi:hypothetical protein
MSNIHEKIIGGIDRLLIFYFQQKNLGEDTLEVENKIYQLITAANTWIAKEKKSVIVLSSLTLSDPTDAADCGEMVSNSNIKIN